MILDERGFILDNRDMNYSRYNWICARIVRRRVMNRPLRAIEVR